jgi:3',5'-cyclic-AMP phosphodiesterase
MAGRGVSSIMPAMAYRMVILADVHVGESRPHAMRHVDASAELLASAVARIVPLRPDRVVLLGDTVNQGWSHEYELAKQLLRPLQGRLEPVLGNHELQRAHVRHFIEEWQVEPVRKTMAGLPAIILSSGIENLPDAIWHGRLDEGQLRFVDEALAEHRDSPVLVFCHHPLADTVRKSDLPLSQVENSPELHRRLSDHGHDAVLFSGHTHAQSIVRRGNIWCVAGPALCFWPHGFLVVDVEGRVLRLRTEKVVDDLAASPDVRAEREEHRRLGAGEAEDQAAEIALG